MTPDLYTKRELKAFIWANCARMPCEGELYKIPYDGWKWVWRVADIKEDSITMMCPMMYRGNTHVHTHTLTMEQWIVNSQAGFIRLAEAGEEYGLVQT